MTIGSTGVVATSSDVVWRLPLFGRERDIANIISHLSTGDVRLLTLTGPGGVGKTRLAIHVAHEIGDTFPDGVHHLSLAAVADPRQLPGEILQTLQALDHKSASELDAIVETLGTRRVLLVLDNMEQIITAGSFISELLNASPGLSILVTSRIPLRISREIEYPVASLSAPQNAHDYTLDELSRNPAVQLFVQRARATRGEFEINCANAPAIAEITRRLDGLPLAIELAAARTKVLAPQALLTRLTNSLQVLSGGPQDAPARLRSMRDAIDWSYELLDESQSALFRALGVFSGGFTLDAVEAVAPQRDGADVLDSVSELVDHSLVALMPEEQEEPRFYLLETIREYAYHALGETGELRDTQRRHADWVRSLVAEASAQFLGPHESIAMNQIQREAGNLRAALTWIVENDVERASELLYDAWYFWGVRGHYREGLDWIERLRNSRDQLSDLALAKLDLSNGYLLWAIGEYETGLARHGSALAGFVAFGDKDGIAHARFGLGSIHRDQDRFEDAEAQLLIALELFEELSDPAWIAFCLSVLGDVARQTKRFDESTRYLERGLSITRSIPFPGGMSPIVDRLGDLARDRGDFAGAIEYHRQTLPFWIDQQDPHGAADSLASFAAALHRSGESEMATRLISAAAATYDRLGFPPSRHSSALSNEILDAMRTALGSEGFAEVWNEGQTMPLDCALKTALAFEPQMAVLSRVDTQHPDIAQNEFGLTARETEILQLLAAGKSNAEIGEMLFISPRTVGTHVANIYGKIGVSNRSAAVAAALRAKARASN